jgi:hypothetical protein
MIKCSYLTTCEVMDEGRSLRLDFLDGAGQPTSVELPFEQAESVVMTLPHMLSKALQQHTQNKRLRYVFTPGHWSIEKADQNFIDFAYQTTILRIAGERGMVRQERLFLAQNTLPLFDRLLDILDAIPGEVRNRFVTPFFYAGLARRYESERITEDICDALPERIAKLRRGRFAEWRSEREWMPVLMETASQPRKLTMKLDVDEANIDQLERLTCEEIFAEREQAYRADYRRMPEFEELCARYGDPNGRKIYILPRDLEQKWMDMHARETGMRIPLD